MLLTFSSGRCDATISLNRAIDKMVFSKGVPKNVCSVCVAVVEEPSIPSTRFLHSNPGQASTRSLRPCMSQSDT